MLNSVLLKQLGKKAESAVHTPWKVMTGTMATLETLVSKDPDQQISAQNMKNIRAQQLLHIENLRQTLENVHEFIA